MKSGKVRENDYGSLIFNFTDGTWASADWVSEGDGEGGGFDEDNVKVGDSGLTPEQIVDLAYLNTGRTGDLVIE